MQKGLGSPLELIQVGGVLRRFNLGFFLASMVFFFFFFLGGVFFFF